MKQIVSIQMKDIEKVSIVVANGHTMKQVKEAEKCDYIINGGLYDTKTYKPVSLLKAGGKVLASEPWGAWGYAWNKGPDVEMRSIPSDAGSFANYIACVALLTPWDGIDAKLSYPDALGGVRGRTAIAMTEDSLVLYCSQDGTGDAKTPEALRQELYNIGAKTAIMLDSGGSSQCIFEGGKTIKTGRMVHNYICVWRKREENKMQNKKLTVCIDPGHGPDTTNGSPDGTYKEQEFAWDMGQRLLAHLQRCGIKTVLTRTQDVKPSLTERASVSNKAGADLFVSIHSNAAGNSGWNKAHGLLIYTSLAGENAGRNKAAKAVLAQMQEAGVELQGSGLAHNGYTVLVKTTAAALLIEYGFHDNQGDVEKLKDTEYRDKLAEATAAGICDYLGVAWVPPAGNQTLGAWEKAISLGIMDATAPQGTVTQEMLAIVLDRLGLLKK